MAEKLLAQQVEGVITAMVYSSNSQLFAYGTAFGSIFIRQIVPGEDISSSISFDEDEFEFDNRYFPGTQLLLSCKANNDSIRSLKWLDDVTLVSTDSAGGISITQIIKTENIEECAENLIVTGPTSPEANGGTQQKLGRDDPISASKFEVILIKQRLCKHPISHLEIFIYLEHLYLAAGDDEGYVHIIKVCDDYKDLKVLQTLGDAGDYITGLAWSEFQSKLYASSADGTLYCYATEKDKRSHNEPKIDLITPKNRITPASKKASNKQKYPVFQLHDNSSPEDFSLTCMLMDPNERYIYCGTSEGGVLIFSVLDISLPTNKLKTSSESIENMIRLYRNYYLLGANDGLVHLVGMYPPMHYGIFCNEFSGAVAVMELSADRSLLTIAEHFSDVFYMMDAQWVHDLINKQGTPAIDSECDENCEEIDICSDGSRQEHSSASLASDSETGDELSLSPRPFANESDSMELLGQTAKQGALEQVLEAPLRPEDFPKVDSSTTDSEMERFFSKIEAAPSEPTLKSTIQGSVYDKNKMKAKRQAFFVDLSK